MIKSAGEGIGSEGVSARTAAVASALVFIAYVLVLWTARGGSFPEVLAGAAANTVPVVALGLVTHGIVVRHIAGRSTPVLILGHLVVGLGFAVLSYWGLLVLLGLVNGVSATEFDVRPFDRRAMAWQTLQNITTYGIIALYAHLQMRSRPAASAVELSAAVDEPGASPGPSRYFIRTGDDLRPIEISAIVCITGADDYAEVRTTGGKHLVRMTLNEFDATLDARRFARVHRSHIVNLDRIARAESAGNGRLLLHMETGEAIQTSRAGSKRVRDRVI